VNSPDLESKRRNVVEETKAKIANIRLVPVVKLDDAAKALALGQALLEGGLPCAEVTFRTDAAEEALRNLGDAYPEMLIGAGTVITVEQARRAVDVGAQFIVSPGLGSSVVEFCAAQGILAIPGVATPTEITTALSYGLTLLKFFPAEAMGGVQTLKALAGPFGDVRFIPSGGINLANLTEYLALPSVPACGGTWMVKSSLIQEARFDEITSLAKEAMAVVASLEA
jgi:2-dehydro-3-deoxyphosphogluconate aldolase/(4S)-4-hydroxy-2-oxoglutarate aldolase